jgi:hypothetical protein
MILLSLLLAVGIGSDFNRGKPLMNSPRWGQLIRLNPNIIGTTIVGRLRTESYDKSSRCKLVAADRTALTDS